MNKRYSVGDFLLDVILTFVTGGIWFVWILFRFIRSNTKN